MATTRNIIGLDVGERRIGVAKASLEARMSSPLLTIDRLNIENIYKEITDLLNKHDAKAVVIGLPRGMEGQETLQTKVSREFAAELKKTCHLPVYLQDEAATSIMAEEKLKLINKPYTKGDIDMQAATIILQDWLIMDQEVSEES